MTLNIMLSSRSAAYLSGDFRLTNLVGGGYSDDLRTQKIVPVIKYEWCALVAFTGVAMTTTGLDVGEWLSVQADRIPVDARFDELPKKLLAANSWLGRLAGERRLAFSIVGFIRRRPVAMVVSNYMDINGRVFRPQPQLKPSEIRPKQPDVGFAGNVESVRDDDRKRLKNALTKSRNPRDLHTLLAEINALCAQRCESISRECVTGHLSPAGTAGVLPHGISTQAEYVPHFVRRSFRASGVIGFICRKDDKGNVLAPQWVQMGAKRQGRSKKSMIVAIAHEMRVERPVWQATPIDDPAFRRI